MRKLKLQMQATLDGFVAGPNGDSRKMRRLQLVKIDSFPSGEVELFYAPQKK